MDLDDKIKHNIWEAKDVLKEVLSVLEDKNWRWVRNSQCKYVELRIRIDMRDGGCLLLDRHGNRITVEQFKQQM